MDYKYLAFNTNKEFSKGIMVADGEEEAEKLIENHNLKVVILDPVKQKFNPLKWKLFEEPLSQKDIIYFIRQLSSLISAGIPILRALSLIQEQAPGQNLRENIARIIAEIRKGNSLSSAMRKQKKAFSAFTIRIMEIGEKSGNMEEVMKHLLSYNEKELETKKKITKALTYPAMIVGMAIAVFILMITVVMPPFLALFQTMGTELPLPTKIMIGITKLPQSMTASKLLPLMVLIVLFFLYLRSNEGRKELHLFILKIPALGKVILTQNLSRINRNLAIQLNAGINLTEALHLIEQMTGNIILKKEIFHLRKSVLQGERLRSAMQNSTVFPSLMKQMIQVGEETGRLEPNLAFLAESYSKESDERIESLIAMIEPVMTISIGVLVTFLALAVVTPSFALMDSIK